MKSLGLAINTTLSIILNADTKMVDQVARYALASYFGIALILGLKMLLGLVLMFFF